MIYQNVRIVRAAVAKQRSSTYMKSELLRGVFKLEGNGGCFSKVRYERSKGFTESKRAGRVGEFECIVGTLYET